ncbi:dephospho-CoA kinase [Halanaerobiaceae bacterium Z-7014]|uniref:Dephospho-CoA kinase n=1 Tax=Halonatronomonas betaini TaxID=2778430 RepID=A0A931AP47_9FIRM|nr:dephospho-CoA kinase [Halonatronomonas betaini]MBF8435902.1 dephospho-CoA kinase [Halonatronomonas betaini]
MALGLTGGIASGKTTAANFLESLGAKIIDADKIAHKIMKPEGSAYSDVVQFFGNNILNEDGSIDRKKLGEIVFNNSELRQKLEKITHPIIVREIKNRLINETDSNTIIVAPLLFEVGLDDLVDQVWVIYCSRETQIKRLKDRDNIARKAALARIDAQMPLDKKIKKADLAIENEGSIDDLKDKLREAWEKWQKGDKYES